MGTTPVLDAVLIVYMTALVAIGLISARYVKGEQSYLVADRRLGNGAAGSDPPGDPIVAGAGDRHRHRRIHRLLRVLL